MVISDTSTKIEKRNYWSQHIKQWKASGDKQRHYCQHHQLKPHQFIYWKRIFSERPKKEPSIAPSGFIAVTVSKPDNQKLILRLPNGVSIEGIHTNNLKMIREIIGWYA